LNIDTSHPQCNRRGRTIVIQTSGFANAGRSL
jgi:hypothetical protein